ncbi:MAG: hypothetical protein V1778_03630 [bacterium]
MKYSRLPSRNRRLRSADASFSQKRFSAIPRKFSRVIKKERFVKDVLGGLFGGSIKGSTNILKRKDVREVLEQSEVLGMLDSTAPGRRSRNPSTLTEDEAIDIPQKIREKIRQNLKERGYGLREQGEFFRKDPKRIYRQVIEKAYAQEFGPSRDEQRQRDLEIRERKAQRRALWREQAGLLPMTTRRIAETAETDRGARGAERRASLERRLEDLHDGKSGGAAPASTTAVSARPHKGVGGSPSAVSPAPFAPYLHVQPQVGVSLEGSTPPEASAFPPSQNEQPHAPTMEEHQAPASQEEPSDPDHKEPPAAAKPEKRIDDDLPL